MDISFFLRGLIIGFSIAAPVGPIGVLCIRRTLAEGRASGLFSGLGAATADAIYVCIAGFGLTFISNFLISQLVWLRLVGGGRELTGSEEHHLAGHLVGRDPLGEERLEVGLGHRRLLDELGAQRDDLAEAIVGQSHHPAAPDVRAGS